MSEIRSVNAKAFARFGMFVLALSLVSLSILALPTPSNAASEQYCRTLVNANAYCGAEPWQRGYSLNVVFYPGAGSVSVCEKVMGPDYTPVISLRCGNGYANSGNDTVGWTQWGLRLKCGNNSNNRHTLNCRGDY